MSKSRENKHGNSEYVNHGCRCETCKTERKNYIKQRRVNNPVVYLKYDEKTKIWQEQNKEYLIEYRELYRELNKDILAFKRKTPKARALKRVNNIIRRALKKQAKGNLTKRSIESRWILFGSLCWMCSKKAEATDHVIPLARGGTNFPSNIRPICNSCNSKKRTRNLTKMPTILLKLSNFFSSLVN